MRRSAIIGVLVVLVVLWLVLVAYLAGPGASTAPAQASPQPARPLLDVGFFPANSSSSLPIFDIEEINLLPPDFAFEGFNISEEKEIHYILGTGVNESGKAVSWMYGIRNASGSTLVIHDDNGWRIIPWKDTFPDRTIDPGSLAGLNTVFQENADLLASPSVTDRKVEVYDNTFFITLGGADRPVSYTFDAVNRSTDSGP